MRTAIIPEFWMGITNRFDAHSLLALDDAVRSRGVDPTDREAVAKVWAKIRTKRHVSRYQRWRRR